MALLDFLRGPQAQQPGAMQQQGGGLMGLLDPSVALPAAAALLGNQGNSANFGNAFGAMGEGMAQQRELQAQTAQKNKTLEFLRQQAPEYAQAVEAGALQPGDAYKMFLDAKKAQKGQGFINAGGGNLYNTATGEWVSAPGGGVDSVAGLQPVWLRDSKTGNPVLGQMRKDGTVVRSGMPDGTEAIGPYDVNFDKAAGSAAGKGTGEAQVALPGVAQMASQVAQQVDDLKNDPYLPEMVGPWNSKLPNVTTDAARVQSKMNQLQGGAFLQARQMLKGGGAITDYEGRKAEEAFARLNAAQSVEDYNRALDDFNTYVQMGLQKLQAQAAQQGMQQGGGHPAGGPVDYKSKYGLD